jgi:hypothetical protein
VSRMILLLMMMGLPSRLLWLGLVLYSLGVLLPRHISGGFGRIVLQRLGFAAALEGLLLFAMGRIIYRPDLPLSLTVFLFGGVMLIGIPALVVWQLRRSRIVERTTGTGGVETRVAAGPRPHWLLVSVTAILVMGLLGAFGSLVGNFVWPGHREGFEPSPMGQAIGLVAGCLLGLALVRYAVRESS